MNYTKYMTQMHMNHFNRNAALLTSNACTSMLWQ